MEYISAREASEKWGISQRRIAALIDNSEGAKPFLKWAGGKSQLLKEIEKYYPFKEEGMVKYAEPFVGGGAVLFDILNKYDLEEAYICDINNELINAYKTITEQVEPLIYLLSEYQETFIPLETEERKIYYYKKRKRFNELIAQKNENIDVEKAAIMIFLNKTCFNGLYRVNRRGAFNVPMGSYRNPLICDAKNLMEISKKLHHITIHCGDYRDSYEFIDKNTFVYFDPPYRPITKTSSFTAYAEGAFDDREQIALAQYVDLVSKKGAKVVVSNSDPKNVNNDDSFFDDIYSQHKISRVATTRMINSDAGSRGKISELLISNR